MMKNLVAVFLTICMVALLTGCSSGTVERKVTCTMCNGTGQVKYYYGDGDNDYNYGPCTSCDEKGYTIVVVDKADAYKKICGGCMKPVDKLITKEDDSGEERTWCEECWADYDGLNGAHIDFSGPVYASEGKKENQQTETQPATETKEDLYQKAIQYLADGNIKEALNLFQELGNYEDAPVYVDHIFLVPVKITTEAAFHCYGFNYDEEKALINEVIPLYPDVNETRYSDLQYDDQGRIVSFKEESPLKILEYTFTYDNNGNASRITVYKGYESETEWHSTFDKYGNLIESDSYKYKYEIDEKGNLIYNSWSDVSNGSSRSYKNTYVPGFNDLLLSSEITKGSHGMSESEQITYQYVYYPDGHINTLQLLYNIKLLGLWAI